MLLLETDFSFFIGRFHPVLVHLPIGFLLLAGIMQMLLKKPKYEKLKGALNLVLFLGAISAILTSVSGWLLANHGDYEDTTLFLHRWLGIGVAILASWLWLIQKGRVQTGRKLFTGLILLMLGMILYGGHLGGSLTHGEDYLVEYAPGFIKSIFGKAQKGFTDRQFSNPDSIIVYKDLIQPVLKKRCFNCHNEKNTNGGLVMSTQEGLLKGGDKGEIIIAGKAHDSEMVNRVTLPRASKKFMPPKGMGMEYYEIRLLEWWINAGASFENSVSETETPEEIKMLLLKKYGLDTKPKPYVETLEVEAISEELFKKLEKQGFKINKLAIDNNLLDISLKTKEEDISKAQLETLVQAKEQITWIDFGGSDIRDEQLIYFKDFSNLTRLRLHQTPITDQGLKHLNGLAHLESLNLYGTNISDASIETFKILPALKRLYLWNTQVSSEAVESLKAALPDLEVDTGFQFAKQEKE